jgi:hypothetical protein
MGGRRIVASSARSVLEAQYGPGKANRHHLTRAHAPRKRDCLLVGAMLLALDQRVQPAR